MVFGFTAGVSFMPIKAFITIKPQAKMASPARPRSALFIMMVRINKCLQWKNKAMTVLLPRKRKMSK